MNWEDFHRYRWLAGLSAIGFLTSLASTAQADGLGWFRLNGLPEVSAGVEAEGSAEETRVSGGSSTYDHISISPLVGLHSTGFIYHPNLLTFDLGGDLGWGWNNTTTSGSGLSQSQNDSSDLLRYLVQLNLLSAKPYNASVYAAQDHTFRDYGTFSSYTVDTTRYGGNLNWNDDAFTLNADLGYRNEQASGLSNTSETTETYFNFLGIHKRKYGATTLTLHASELENILNYGSQMDSQNWSAGVSDSETFGRRKQMNASSGLSYSQSEYSGLQINTLNASENLAINHRPNLDSYLMMNFNQSEFQSVTSTRVQGTAGVRHQLYESLTSNLEGNGTHQEDAASSGDSTYDQYGLGLNENYSKRLQTWGHLSLGTGVGVNHQEQNSPAGILTTPSETQVLYDPTSPSSLQPVYLSRPRIITASVQAIQVNVPGGSLTQNTDFQTISHGELTEVKLLPTFNVLNLISLAGTNNLSVTFTYQSESLGSSSYDTFGASAQFRLDLWNQVGLYGRVNWQDNNAPPEALTQTLTDLVGGMDYKRKWFRAGAEYESYDSNFAQYQALRLFQEFNFIFSDTSALSFDFNQSFYSYEAGRDQSQYQFTSRYSARLPLSLTWYLEGGGLVQEYSGTEQVQGIARTGISWSRGKLSLRAGYEFNSQSTASGSFTEERIKHRFFTYLRRSF